MHKSGIWKWMPFVICSLYFITAAGGCVSINDKSDDDDSSGVADDDSAADDDDATIDWSARNGTWTIFQDRQFTGTACVIPSGFAQPRDIVITGDSAEKLAAYRQDGAYEIQSVSGNVVPIKFTSSQRRGPGMDCFFDSTADGDWTFTSDDEFFSESDGTYSLSGTECVAAITDPEWIAFANSMPCNFHLTYTAPKKSDSTTIP